MCNFFFRGLPVEEIQNILDEDIEDDELDEDIQNDELDRIYIEPPEVGVEPDKDSADEDEAGLVDNLSEWQLWAGAIACFRNGISYW